MEPKYIVISSDNDSEPDEPPQKKTKKCQQETPADVIDLTSDSESERPIFRFSLSIKLEINSGCSSGKASVRPAKQTKKRAGRKIITQTPLTQSS